MTKLILTYCPCPNEEQAKKLARKILEEKIAACAQIIPNITSLYWWQGKIEEDSEVSLLIKSSAQNAQNVQSFLEQLHPYDCPCIIQQEIDKLNPAYVQWLSSLEQ